MQFCIPLFQYIHCNRDYVWTFLVRAYGYTYFPVYYNDSLFAFLSLRKCWSVRLPLLHLEPGTQCPRGAERSRCGVFHGREKVSLVSHMPICIILHTYIHTYMIDYAIYVGRCRGEDLVRTWKACQRMCARSIGPIVPSHTSSGPSCGTNFPTEG